MSSNKRKLSLDNLDLSKMKLLRKDERITQGSQSSVFVNSINDLLLDNLMQSQGSVPNLNNCGLCAKTVDVDEIEISSLKCCLCDVYYHGCCMDISDEVLSLLYVVKNLDGWCCVKCRKLFKSYTNSSDLPLENSQKKATKPNNKTVDLSDKIASNNEDMILVKSQLQHIVDDLKTFSIQLRPCVASLDEASTGGDANIDDSAPDPSGPHSDDGSSWQVKGKKPLQLAKPSTNSSGKKIQSMDSLGRNEMLVAMHSEMATVSKRAAAVVVSGRPSRNDVTDLEQFTNLCIHISISLLQSNRRFASVARGKERCSLCWFISPPKVTPPLSYLLRETCERQATTI